MSALGFKIVPNTANLYVEVGDQPRSTTIYWLLLDGNPSADLIPLAETWGALSGCHIFVPTAVPISDPGSFAKSLTRKFQPPQGNQRFVAWVHEPDTLGGLSYVQALCANSTCSHSATSTSLTLDVANIDLKIPNNSNLSFENSVDGVTDQPSLVFSTSSRGGAILLMREDSSSGVLAPDNGLVAVPLSGPFAGSAVFAATGWDRGDFYTLFQETLSSWDTPAGSEMRYFHGPDPATPNQIRYPVFKPEDSSGTDNMKLALDVRLDPLAPFSSDRTRFGLNVDLFDKHKFDLPKSEFFFATDGNVMQLSPQNNAGYALSKRPKGKSTGQATKHAYLAPIGHFDAKIVNKVDDAEGVRNFLCGLTGTEFLLVAPGATVEFITEQKNADGTTGLCPAYTKHFVPPSNSSGGAAPSYDPCNPPEHGGTPIDPDNPLLDSTYSTSWMRITPPPTPPPDRPIHYGYAVQPEAAVYYSSLAAKTGGADYPYPMALGCRVSQLDIEKSETPTTSLPMAAYGGLAAISDQQDVSATTLKAFESQIVGTTRYHEAPKDTVNGPTFFDPISHIPCGGRARTPEGLLVELNDTGTWKTLHLAKSPNANPIKGAGRLTIDGEPVINPILSNALMNDKLFMVATDPKPLGKFENEIQMDEWTFQLDVGAPGKGTPQDPYQATLIFKFTAGLSLLDLVSNAAYWQYWKDFIAAPEAVSNQDVWDVQKRLNQLLCEANPNGAKYGGKVFENIWSKATDPNWTGIIAMNCRLDAKDLPIDLQDLFGGINGELRAHHFGITVNQINSSDKGKISPSTDWSIDKSSLFALVHYKADYEPPTDSHNGKPQDPHAVDKFQVLRLNALFENSALVHFDSRIAVTIPKLFQQPVTLVSPKNPNPKTDGFNVLEIEGAYQKHGDVGKVVFETKEPFIFTFDKGATNYRALQEIYLTDAELSPVSSTGTDPIIVKSNFAMSGLLLFSKTENGKKAPEPDPFSYGEGMAIPPTGVPFSDYNIAMTTEIKDNFGNITEIGPDISAFRIQSAGAVPRKNSLAASFPMKLQSFVDWSGSTSRPEGWPVETKGFSSDAFDATYGLRFQISLGSLGELSSYVDALDVDILIGWKPATKDDEDDTVWVLMVPPKTMRGHEGFGIQGVLATTFYPVELTSVYWPLNQTVPDNEKLVEYGLYLKNVGIELLSLELIPPGLADFTLFSKPGGDGNKSNLGWLASLRIPKI